MARLLVAFLTLFIVLGLSPTLFGNAYAASLSFDPSSVSKNAGEAFDIKVDANAGSDQITSVDAYITYDANVLEVQSVTNGTFFPTVTKDTSQAGKVYIAGLVDDPATSKTGTGTLATITFKGKTSGSAILAFTCTQGSTSDSNITKNDLNATDIITCSSNGSSAITIGSGSSSGGSSSGGSSSGGSSTSGGTTPAPTELPKSGVFDNVVKYSVPGIILLLLGGIAKLIL